MTENVNVHIVETTPLQPLVALTFKIVPKIVRDAVETVFF